MARMTVSLSFELLNGTDCLNRYQPRQMRESEQASAQGTNEAPLSWFDQDNTSDDRSGKETGQRSNTQRERSSYRQGIIQEIHMNDSFGCGRHFAFKLDQNRS